MDLPTLLNANRTLIRRELALVSARPPARTPRVVDTPGWEHDTCDDEAILVTTRPTHTETLCCRCGYRAYHALDGRLLGHHGGHGLIVLRRPNHGGDIVLTDFTDRSGFSYTFISLKSNRPYSAIVISEPQYTSNEFQVIAIRGRLDDLDDTPLRTYLSTSQRIARDSWADWRRTVFSRLDLPVPFQTGELDVTDRSCTETGDLEDGRTYTLHAFMGRDPHNPRLTLKLEDDLLGWTSHS